MRWAGGGRTRRWFPPVPAWRYPAQENRNGCCPIGGNTPVGGSPWMAPGWLQRRPALAKPWRRRRRSASFPRSLCMLMSLPNCRSGGGEPVPYPLSFHARHAYEQSDRGVSVPVSLSAGPETVRLFAKIDTGADYCLFERGFAEALLLEVERGIPSGFSTAAGEVHAYGHDLTLAALGVEGHALG